MIKRRDSNKDRRMKSAPRPPRTGMVDTAAPPIRLLAKIGAILMIFEELVESDFAVVDWKSFRCLLADRQVQAWLEGMRRAEYLPLDPSSREQVPDLDKIFGYSFARVMAPASPMAAEFRRIQEAYEAEYRKFDAIITKRLREIDQKEKRAQRRSASKKRKKR